MHQTRWTRMRRMLDQEQREEFKATFNNGNPQEAWGNDRYFVVVEFFGDRPKQAHLMIRRHDRAPIHNWSDLQRIKNEVIGPEVEAIELYPAESRLVDTGNTYHLWAVLGIRLPFGYQEGDRRWAGYSPRPSGGRP
jgi:hypothetical protein